MDAVLLILEMIGTVAFAVSGAMTGLKKGMDIFGVAILGVTTAVGGGILRDLILGLTPPSAFRDPVYALVAAAVSLIVFFPAIRRALSRSSRAIEQILLVTDSLGLGIFSVMGVSVAERSGAQTGFFLLVFVGVVTGVGGGVMRDLFAGNTPYIFVRHIYACASLAGTLVCVLLWPWIPSLTAMLIGMGIVFFLRLLAAHFRWSLPKAKEFLPAKEPLNRVKTQNREKQPATED